MVIAIACFKPPPRQISPLLQVQAKSAEVVTLDGFYHSIGRLAEQLARNSLDMAALTGLNQNLI